MHERSHQVHAHVVAVEEGTWLHLEAIQFVLQLPDTFAGRHLLQPLGGKPSKPPNPHHQHAACTSARTSACSTQHARQHAAGAGCSLVQCALLGSCALIHCCPGSCSVEHRHGSHSCAPYDPTASHAPGLEVSAGPITHYLAAYTQSAHSIHPANTQPAYSQHTANTRCPNTM